MSRARNFVFTYNNPADVHLGGRFDIPLVKYLVYQLEVGASGTPHLQGLVCFHTLKSFGQVKALFPVGVHIEKMRGTLKQARAYAMKDDTRSPDPSSGPHEFGDVPEGTVWPVIRVHVYRFLFAGFLVLIEQLLLASL